MEIIILPNEEAVATRSADLVESQIRAFPDTVLGLATGSSPLGLYRELIRRHQQHELSFHKVRTFNLDEYVGIPADHSQSYRTFMDENLFKGIDIDPSNTHVPDGIAENPLEAGPAFENPAYFDDRNRRKQGGSGAGYDRRAHLIDLSRICLAVARTGHGDPRRNSGPKPEVSGLLPACFRDSGRSGQEAQAIGLDCPLRPIASPYGNE